MATPSSSATSPSPPMSYLQPIVPMGSSRQGPSSSSLSSGSSSKDSVEGERRKKAVQKFLARAELSNVTRNLRTRLSYASLKTTHNTTATPFGDLDAQTQMLSPSAPAVRSYAAKRKAPQQPAGNVGGNPTRRGSIGPSPRTPTINANSGASTSASTSHADHNAQTLFTSILAPPPPNQARTILNANDPPVAAPVRPAMSPNLRNAKVVRSIAEGTRAQAKSRRVPDKQRKDKSKKKAVDADGDVDMEAAATLTSLLLHHRPSIAGSASSPRSSIDGSEPSSSLSQLPQASHSSFASIPPAASASTASTSYRSNTPPRSSNNTPAQQTTPRPAPTDNEAADLMLFLATSPSPARPNTSKEARDAAAFRALGQGNNHANSGSMMRAKPRVLFPTQGDQPDEAGRWAPRVGPGLGRSDSFASSSISSIGSDMGGHSRPSSRSAVDRNHSPTSQQSSSSAAQQQQHVHSSAAHGAHLLPPPSLPAHPSSSFPSSPSSLRQESSAPPGYHPAAGQADFNFNEFIHASPSASPTRPAGGNMPTKMNLGLRADVGRKLFEEEQIRLGKGPPQRRRLDDRGLEAGIDLVRT